MVPLGLGQAIIGGHGRVDHLLYDKIFFINCASRDCMVSLLDQRLSKFNAHFLAIPVPDSISGCITGGNNSNTYRKVASRSKSMSLLVARLG